MHMFWRFWTSTAYCRLSSIWNILLESSKNQVLTINKRHVTFLQDQKTAPVVIFPKLYNYLYEEIRQLGYCEHSSDEDFYTSIDFFINEYLKVWEMILFPIFYMSNMSHHLIILTSTNAFNILSSTMSRHYPWSEDFTHELLKIRYYPLEKISIWINLCNTMTY